MFYAKHSILLMSKIEFCWFMSFQSVCKHSRVINTQRGKCKYSIFFFFALTASWWFAKLEKGGMQIPDFVSTVYHIKIQGEYKQLTV